MMDTKEKILQKSLQLFNEFGISKVSQRKIAKCLSISPGNLTYHFKKKEDIEETLYFQLTTNISADFKRIDTEEINLSFILTLMNQVFTYIHTYRFVFLDIVYLIRSNPKISDDYKRLIKNRKKRFLQIYNSLLDAEILQNEKLPNEYEYLYKRLEILFDFYLSSVEISQKGITHHHIKKHSEIFLYSIFPYLTDKGQNEFIKLINHS